MIQTLLLAILFVRGCYACGSIGSPPPPPLPKTECDGCCMKDCCLDDGGNEVSMSDDEAHYCGANMKMNVFTENKCQCNEKMNTRDWYEDEIGKLHSI